MKFNLCLVLAGLTLFLSGCFRVSTLDNTDTEMAREARVKELLGRATLNLRKGSIESYHTAESELALALDLAPNDPRVVDGLGCIAWRLANIVRAEYFFKTAIALDPNYDRAYAHLAAVAEHNGDMAAAHSLLEQAVKLNPVNYRSRNNLAAFLINHGDAQDSVARADFELIKAARSGGAQELVVTENQSLARRRLESSAVQTPER